MGGETETRESLALQLQGMRSGLEQYRTGERSGFSDAPELLFALLERYDDALVRAAALLDVARPGVPAGGLRLSDEARTQLEDALRAAGLELEPPPDDAVALH